MNREQFVEHIDYYIEKQNADLRDQVERLKQAVISTRARGNLLHNITTGLIQGAELNGSDWDYISEYQVDEITQHLRDRDAEAGRAGFYEGIKYDSDSMSDEYIDAVADEYAAKVREGDNRTINQAEGK